MGLFSKPEVIGPGGGNDADRSRIAQLEHRVTRLEAQLAQLASDRGSVVDVPAAETWMSEVQSLRSAGKTIHAIKLYREHTGVGLKEAKDAVEALPG